MAVSPGSSFTQTIPGTAVELVMRPVPLSGAGTLWVAETELTWDAYDAFLHRLDVPADRRASADADPGPDAITRPTPPYRPPDRGWGHAGYPALGVTYHAAQTYCRWLSQRTGRKYRLPTVAEWEQACGAGLDATTAPTGRAAAERAWCEENGDEQAHAVATKPPNSHGLHDMLGNVAEWCAAPDGTGVACGGSFLTPAADLHCRLHETQTPAWNQSDGSFPKSKWWLADAPFVGFRVVCDRP
jgi:formylglycine-generating enzyme required for sulfatase activity